MKTVQAGEFGVEQVKVAEVAEPSPGQGEILIATEASAPDGPPSAQLTTLGLNGLGSPLDEAHALAGLGRCAAAAGHTGEAGAWLGQALEIFRVIGAPEAADVPAELGALSG
jgi:hypothetical protein